MRVIPSIFVLLLFAVPMQAGISPLEGSTRYLHVAWNDDSTTGPVALWSREIILENRRGLVCEHSDSPVFIESYAFEIWPKRERKKYGYASDDDDLIDQLEVDVSLDFRMAPPNGAVFVRGSENAEIWTPWQRAGTCTGRDLIIWGGREVEPPPAPLETWPELNWATPANRRAPRIEIIQVGNKGFTGENSRTWTVRLFSRPDNGTQYVLGWPIESPSPCTNVCRTSDTVETAFPIRGIRYLQVRWESDSPVENLRIAGLKVIGWAEYGGAHQ